MNASHIIEKLVKGQDIIDFLTLPILVEEGTKQNKSQSFLTMVENEPSLISTTKEDGTTVLHQICSMGYADLIPTVLQHAPALLRQSNYHGQMPIHTAALNDQYDCFDRLLEYAENPSDLTNHKQQNPLHVAAKYCHKRYLEKCVDKKIDINQGDGKNRTPLMLSIRYDNQEAFDFLIHSEELDCTLQDQLGWNAMDYAIDSKNTYFIAQLKDKCRLSPAVLNFSME